MDNAWHRQPPQPVDFAEWCDRIRSSCGKLQVTTDNPTTFRGEMVAGQLGPVNTSVVHADPHTVLRTRRAINLWHEEFIYVCGVLDGEVRARQDNRELCARRGELISFDSTRTFTLCMPERFRMVVLKVPHCSVRLTPGASHAVTAANWSGVHGVSALLWPLMFSLGDHLTDFDTVTADQVGTVVTNLVSTLVAEQLRQIPDPDRQATRCEMFLRVSTYALDHLADPDLSPESLARAHHIYLRHLQKLFQEQQASPASWIRDERLERCKADLSDHRLRSMSVASIGARWGLPAASHFGRLFRDRYGMSPQEYRRRALPHPLWQPDGEPRAAVTAGAPA